MRDDLIKILSRQKDLTHVFFLTFNIDFIFIESVLLRELRKCGHPTLTILADAGEVSRTFQSQGRWVSRIGRRYRVVPITMEPGFRFHPKAVLLSGSDRAELFVGSGNLTFGGMRQNDEIWTRFSSDEDGTGPLAAFRAFAEGYLQRADRAPTARSELRDAFDADQHKWAASLGEPSGLLGRMGRGVSLLDQMEHMLGDLDVQRIVVASPYFDDAGEALSSIGSRWPRVPLEVLVQPEHSQLTQQAWSGLRDPKSLRSVSTGRGEDVRAFIHAKFYAFVGASETVVLAGSANCSRAALIIPGAGGNAELLAVMRMPTDRFDEVVLSAVRPVDDPPQLRTEPTPQNESVVVRSIRIRAARYEHGMLTIDFAAPADLRGIELIADGGTIATAEFLITEGTLNAHGTGAVSRVQIAGEAGGARCISPEHWVDHEFALAATSHQRRIAQAIGNHVSPGQWTFQGWAEVLRLLGDHLQYIPKDRASQPERKDAEKTTPVVLDPSEFFTDDYRLPGQRRELGPVDDVARVLGLRGLLLEYFDLGDEDNETERSDEENGEDEDAVDRQVDVRKRQIEGSRKLPKRDLTDAERRRARRIARQIVDACTSQRFIELRPASMLSSDLAILAVLLVSGYAERWLADEDFLELTYRAWTFLFFDDGIDAHSNDRCAGALDRRLGSSADQRMFVESFRSSRLSASLATWCFCCPAFVSHAEAARFQFATRFAVARLPWLWQLGDRETVERELFEIAQRTGWLGRGASTRWDEVRFEWNLLFEEGLALARLENVLLQQELASLREAVVDDAVPAGTLLWQGPKLGFGVLAQAAERSSLSNQAVTVLTLRSSKRETRLMPSFLLPFRGLVKFATERAPARVSPSHAHALIAFANRLESMIAKRC